MANYFVSTSGSDITGDGLTVATAWRTIDYGISHAGNGTAEEWNMVIIESGVYTGYVSESNRQYIHIYGDVNGEYFSSVGEIRIERSSGNIFCITGYSGISDKRLIVENIIAASIGQHSVTKAFSGNESVRFIRCTALDCVYGIQYNYPAPIYPSAEECLMINCTTGGRFLRISRSIFLFCYNATSQQSTCWSKDCIAVGNFLCGFDGVTYGCISIGGYAPYYGGANYNAVSIGREGYSVSHREGNLRLAYGGWEIYDGSSWSYITGNLKYPNYSRLLTVLSELFIDLPLLTDQITEVSDTDIMGRPRIGSDGVQVNPGCFSIPDIDIDELAITVNRLGAEIYELPCKAGVETTLTCDISSTGTSTRPQLLIYDQDGNLIDSDTATADSDTLTVSVTPSHDYVYRVWLYATDSTAGASTTFSNIMIDYIRAIINENGEIYPVIFRTGRIQEDLSMTYIEMQEELLSRLDLETDNADWLLQAISAIDTAFKTLIRQRLADPLQFHGLHAIEQMTIDSGGKIYVAGSTNQLTARAFAVKAVIPNPTEAGDAAFRYLRRSVEFMGLLKTKTSLAPGSTEIWYFHVGDFLQFHPVATVATKKVSIEYIKQPGGWESADEMLDIFTIEFLEDAIDEAEKILRKKV